MVTAFHRPRVYHRGTDTFSWLYNRNKHRDCTFGSSVDIVFVWSAYSAIGEQRQLMLRGRLRNRTLHGDPTRILITIVTPRSIEAIDIESAF